MTFTIMAPKVVGSGVRLVQPRFGVNVHPSVPDGLSLSLYNMAGTTVQERVGSFIWAKVKPPAYQLGTDSQPLWLPFGQKPDTEPFRARRVKRLEEAADVQEVWMDDSPYNRVADEYTKVTVDQQFRSYLCYKPDGPDAIWAPLLRFDWLWAAVVQRTDLDDARTLWRQELAATDPPFGGPGLSGHPATELPTWTKNLEKDLAVQ
ncbi:hypothetical protein [Actinoallomurus acaciae]|uniref:Uncharacterized protein n=1 Tax=Actinoallomurus acaciae TaxID=502577 RepID=A0ABV5YBN8_9ACTN